LTTRKRLRVTPLQTATKKKIRSLQCEKEIVMTPSSRVVLVLASYPLFVKQYDPSSDERKTLERASTCTLVQKVEASHFESRPTRDDKFVL
jgi:hypothetical protein